MPIPDKIDPEEAIRLMSELVHLDASPMADTEIIHSEADEILLALLKHFGQEKIVSQFRLLTKWYA